MAMILKAEIQQIELKGQYINLVRLNLIENDVFLFATLDCWMTTAKPPTEFIWRTS